MLLKSVCTPNAVSCSPGISAIAAARLMRHEHVGDLVVVAEDSEPLGVITDRDIVVEVLATGHDPATTSVGSLMRKPVVVASENEDVADAIDRMRTHGVRRLPVVGNDGKLKGIVTLDDLLKQLTTETSALVDVIRCEQTRENRHRR